MEMKALSILEPGQIAVIKKEKPQLKDDEVLVKNKFCGICTFEQRLFTGAMKLWYPIIPGHEAVGVVEKAGEKAKKSGLKKGDVVALDLLNRCGYCFFCVTGKDNLCENRFDRDLNFMGGFGEYLAVPFQQAVKAATDVPLEELALAEPLADCIHSYSQARLSNLDKILIIGGGTMGLLHLMMSKKWGLMTIVMDIDPYKLAKAEKIGADYVLNPQENQENLKEKLQDLLKTKGPDTVIVTAPGVEATKTAFDVIANKGKIVFYSSNHPPLHYPLDINELHYREISLTGSISRTKKDFFKAVRIINEKSLPLHELITAYYPITKGQEAFEHALQKDSYRVMLTFD